MGDPFQLQAGHRLHVERAPHVAIGVGGDEHAAAWGGALDAAGPVDDLADDHELLPRSIAECARPRPRRCRCRRASAA